MTTSIHNPVFKIVSINSWFDLSSSACSARASKMAILLSAYNSFSKQCFSSSNADYIIKRVFVATCRISLEESFTKRSNEERISSRMIPLRSPSNSMRARMFYIQQPDRKKPWQPSDGSRVGGEIATARTSEWSILQPCGCRLECSASSAVLRTEPKQRPQDRNRSNIVVIWLRCSAEKTRNIHTSMFVFRKEALPYWRINENTEATLWTHISNPYINSYCFYFTPLRQDIPRIHKRTQIHTFEHTRNCT